jgi:uncharacterized DUF497 family protein
MLLFEWDTEKAKKNIKIHGVSFDEASTAFKDDLSLTIYDPLHSEEEDRLILIVFSGHRGRCQVKQHMIKLRHAATSKT